jgi:Mg2+-importing ATPase
MRPFWLEPHLDNCPGLSSSQAKELLKKHGPNRVAENGSQSGFWLFLATFTNPLVMVLLAASAVSASLGEGGNALIIGVILLVSSGLDFGQSYSSQRAAEKLRASVATRAEVERDGMVQEIPLEEVVPGDILLLSAGSVVAGDCRLLSCKDLCTSEATLTGEALPVEKRAGELGPECESLADAVNSVFLGTSVVNGVGRAQVVQTGPNTQLGKVARNLQGAKGLTEFERGTRSFGLLILRTTLTLVAFVFLTSILFHRPPLQSLLFAVALAVGLTPEFLPMIVSVTLAAGAARLAREKVVVKRLSALENLGGIDILCSDKTGTLTLGHIKLEKYVDLEGEECPEVLRYAALNSAFQSGIHSPLDEAVLAHDHPSVDDHSKLNEIPFDFERRRLSVLLRGPQGTLLVTKGAPESVDPLCVAYQSKGQESRLDEPARQRLRETFEDLSRQGYRVLSVAVGRGELSEQGLCLIGLAAFLDPPRKDAAETVAALNQSGVAIKILTGDNELVARKVCSEVGLPVERILLGRDIDRLSDEALGVQAEQIALFARLSPGQKNRVITALRCRGHVVGYLGDGINDAPSLRNADIGISVDSAVDVAREAADMILLQPGLGPVHLGVLEGRRSFGNILKYVLMGTSSNFGNMFSMAGAAVFLPFLPLLPAQLLLNTLLYDLSQLAIPKDYVDPRFLARPQRWNTDLIRKFMLTLGPLSSIFDFLTFAVLLRVFNADPELFRSGWFVESLVTQVLVVFVIRTSGSPWSHLPHPALVGGAALVVLVGWLLPSTGWLGFEPLPWLFYGYVVLASLIYLMLVQLVKRFFYRKHSL